MHSMPRPGDTDPLPPSYALSQLSDLVLGIILTRCLGLVDLPSMYLSYDQLKKGIPQTTCFGCPWPLDSSTPLNLYRNGEPEHRRLHRSLPNPALPRIPFFSVFAAYLVCMTLPAATSDMTPLSLPPCRYPRTPQHHPKITLDIYATPPPLPR